MKIIHNPSSLKDIPYNFTGIIQWPSGAQEWYRNSMPHRLDGPAITYFSTRTNQFIPQYWVKGNLFSQKQFEIFQYLWNNTESEKTEELLDALIKLSK